MQQQNLPLNAGKNITKISILPRFNGKLLHLIKSQNLPQNLEFLGFTKFFFARIGWQIITDLLFNMILPLMTNKHNFMNFFKKMILPIFNGKLQF